MQEKVAGSRFACLTRVSGTAASTGLHTVRAAWFHLKSRRPDFPWPCCLDAFMPAHRGHLPPAPSCTRRRGVGNPIDFTKQVSNMRLLCDSHRRDVSYPGTAVCLWGFTRPQLYHLTLRLSTAFLRQLQHLVAQVPFCSYAPAWSNCPITCCFICSSHLLPSALSTPVWSLVRVSRADTCSSVSLQLLLEVSRVLGLVRDGSKPHRECAGLCSRTLHSPILQRVTCFRG